jgi:hypothetical protein
VCRLCRLCVNRVPSCCGFDHNWPPVGQTYLPAAALGGKRTLAQTANAPASGAVLSEEGRDGESKPMKTGINVITVLTSMKCQFASPNFGLCGPKARDGTEDRAYEYRSAQPLHPRANGRNGWKADTRTLAFLKLEERSIEAVMRRRRHVLVVALLGVSLVATSCDALRSIHSYRYRITVEVDTPDGLRTGSSVWQVKQWEGEFQTGLHSRVQGGAVPVQLAHGSLFALLRGQDMNLDYAAGLVDGHLSRHPLPGLVMTSDWEEDMRRFEKAKPAFELYPDEYPLLVRFRNKGDPASIEQVDASNLEAAFGPGVYVRRITIAVTDDRPERRILALLPWLKNQRGALERCPRGTLISQKPLKCKITERDFLQRQG